MRPVNVVGSIILVCLLAVTGWFYVDSLKLKSDSYETNMKFWQSEARVAGIKNDSLRAEHNIVIHQVDSIDKIVDTRDQRIAKLNEAVLVMRHKNDSTLVVLKKTLPDTCKTVIELAERYNAEADSNYMLWKTEALNNRDLKYENFLLKRDNSKIIANNDSLVKLLRTVPVYKEPKAFGFIPLPNRKTSFVIGGTVGVVVGVAVMVVLHR